MRGHRKRERIFDLISEFSSDYDHNCAIINDIIQSDGMVVEKFSIDGRIGKSMDDEGNMSLYDEVKVKMVLSDYGYDIGNKNSQLSLMSVSYPELEMLEDDNEVIIEHIGQKSLLNGTYSIIIIRRLND